MNASERHCDLMRQGFMRVRRTRKLPEARPIVACDDCLNWHSKGRHTADAATRKARRAARKSASPVQPLGGTHVSGAVR